MVAQASFATLAIYFGLLAIAIALMGSIHERWEKNRGATRTAPRPAGGRETHTRAENPDPQPDNIKDAA